MVATTGGDEPVGRLPISPSGDSDDHDAELQRKQIEQAEELFFEGPQKEGFAKDLFFGKFRDDAIFPYPALRPDDEAECAAAVREVRRFADEHIDSARIDREALIPDSVVLGLGQVGVLACASRPNTAGAGSRNSSIAA
jgi:hypothetical protein